LTDNTLKELFDQVERYALPLIANDPESKFSKDECRILALQQLNRLNQKIGMIARSNRTELVDMKALQTFVNSITVGVKNGNVPQLKYGLTQTKNMISTLSKET
jgi:hypothetical protein